jgi:hypothetical protein
MIKNTFADITLPIGLISDSADSFTLAERILFLLNICAENLVNRQSSKKLWSITERILNLVRI